MKYLLFLVGLSACCATFHDVYLVETTYFADRVNTAQWHFDSLEQCNMVLEQLSKQPQPNTGRVVRFCRRT